MPEPGSRTEPDAVLRRLQDATNAHDIEAICACFAPGYRNETPVHPARSFAGSEQVRRNWTQILTSIPDLVAEVGGSAVSGDARECRRSKHGQSSQPSAANPAMTGASQLWSNG
jgi:hypothetical protein